MTERRAIHDQLKRLRALEAENGRLRDENTTLRVERDRLTLRWTDAGQTKPGPSALLLDLDLRIRDRAAISRIHRADLERVLTARGWSRHREHEDGTGALWARPDRTRSDATDMPVLVPADDVVDRVLRTAEAMALIALVEGVGQLRILVELVPELMEDRS